MPGIMLVYYHFILLNIHTDKLLEEHEANTNDSTLPASMSKAVEPRLYF